MKQQLIVPVAVLTITGALLLGAATTQAQTVMMKTEPTNLIQKIAQKFGLNEAEVRAVFEEERTVMERQMKARHEERLNHLVTEGKITEAQKKLILDKQAELQANREKNFVTQKQSLEKWAQDNGIDPQYLMGGFKMKMRGFGKAN